MLPDRLRLGSAAHHVRAAAALGQGRPDWKGGLRAAVATMVPLVAADVLHLPGGAGIWLSLAGFSGALVDKGGAYRVRATAIATFAALGAVAVALAVAVQGNTALAVATTALFALACGLVRAWGNVGASIGGSALNTFVIALAVPASDPRELWLRAVYVLAGCAWVAVLALVLWPLRPYRPARLAVAACYRALAAHVDAVLAALADPSPDAVLPSGSADTRAALEGARATLAAIRRGRPGESGRGERLVVLRESCDQLFGNVIALAEMIETVPRSERAGAAQRALGYVLARTAELVRAIADGVEVEGRPPVPAVAWSGDALRAALAEAAPRADVRAQYEQMAVVVDRLAQFGGVAAANLAALDAGHAPAAPAASTSVVEEVEEARPWYAPLASVLDRESLLLAYAARLAIMTAAAVWLTAALDIKHGYWVTITVVIILQPYTGATTLKAVQRVLGTVVGGVLTAALGATVHDARGIMLLSFVFAGISVALLPLNYTAYSVFLTPTFVLLAEASAGDWHLARVRVVDTILGGALALLGSRVLWPSPEWSRVPMFAARTLRACRDYLRIVVAEFGDRGARASDRIRAARRDVALALQNTEESFQRLLAEQGGEVERLAAVMTLLTYVRRFTASTAALAMTRHSVDVRTAGALAEFERAVAAILDDAAATVEGTTDGPPAEPPAGRAERLDALAADAASEPVVRARLVRLARQLRTLAESARAVAAARQ